MKLEFNSQGNLEKDYSLNFEQLIDLFGTNNPRVELIKNLIKLCKTFKSLNCKEFYVVGSFITTKFLPNDIDVCIDITNINESKLEKLELDLFSEKGLQKIHKINKVHIIYYDFGSTEIRDWFRFDRSNNQRGLIKMEFKDF